jgi:hypothetical protein
MIDDVLHPFFGHSKASIVVDIVLHGLVEQNPQRLSENSSTSLPKIVEEILENCSAHACS